MVVQVKSKAAGLQFIHRWATQTPEGTAAQATRGRLEVRLGGRVVWPMGNSNETWPWVELLEHLSGCWSDLVNEMGLDPLGLGGSPAALWQRADERWHSRSNAERISDAQREREEDLLQGYLRTHDLAEGLRGTIAPSLYIFRDGDQATVTSDTAEARLSWVEVHDALVGLGASICDRLTDLADPRAVEAVASWNGRDRASRLDQLRATTGWSAQALEELATGSSVAKLDKAFGLQSNEECIVSSLAWAARMVGQPRSPRALRALFAPVLASPAGDASALEAWRKKCPRLSGEKFEEGYELADWLRDATALSPQQPFEIDGFLAALGVRVIDEPARGVSADAICVWEKNRRGPVVVVNSLGPHAQGQRGRRATLCHELCHLLIDLGGRVLPTAEAKTCGAPGAPGAPADLEARCNAFAAELLMPREAASEHFHDVTLAGVEPAIDNLSRRYGASRAIVAWQVLNSDARTRLGTRLTQRLGEMARRNSNFRLA